MGLWRIPLKQNLLRPQSLAERPLLPSGHWSRVCNLLMTFMLIFFLFLLKEEEVKKLECTLSCYMWGQFAVDIKPSKDSQLSAVSNGNSKHILNKELKVFRRLSDLLAQIGLITLAHQKQLRYWFKCLSNLHAALKNHWP